MKQRLWRAVRGAPQAQSTPLPDLLRAWVGCGLAMLALAALEKALQTTGNLPLLMGSLGASAVLLFGAPQSPLAQPRNVIGGHVLSALAGVTAFQLLGGDMLAAGGAVSGALALMHLTRTFHPPGGATALMAVIGGEGIQSLGYAYALLPCGVGAVLIVLLAFFLHTLPHARRHTAAKE